MSRTSMTPRTWAEKKVEEYGLNVPDIGRMIHKETGVALLMAEHQRAVRIIKRLQKQAHLDEFSMSADQLDAYLEALQDILAALERGRK